MGVQRELALVLREARACSVDRTIGLPQAQESRRVALIHYLGELVGLRLTLQCVLSQLEQRLIGEDREVIACDLPDEADLGAAARVALRKVLLESCGAEAALAAEEIKLVIGKANPSAVVAKGFSGASAWH